MGQNAGVSVETDRLISGKPTSAQEEQFERDRKSTRLNSSHSQISYAVFCLKKKNTRPVKRDPADPINFTLLPRPTFSFGAPPSPSSFSSPVRPSSPRSSLSTSDPASASAL